MEEDQSLYLQIISHKLLMTSELFALLSFRLTYIHFLKAVKYFAHGEKTWGQAE